MKIIEILYQCTNNNCENKFIEKVADERVYELKNYVCNICNLDLLMRRIAVDEKHFQKEI